MKPEITDRLLRRAENAIEVDDLRVAILYLIAAVESTLPEKKRDDPSSHT